MPRGTYLFATVMTRVNSRFVDVSAMSSETSATCQQPIGPRHRADVMPHHHFGLPQHLADVMTRHWSTLLRENFDCS